MYDYDRKRKILYMSKLPIDTEFHGYEISDHYKAFKNYLYNIPTSDIDVCLRNDFKMLGSAMASAYNKRKRTKMSPVEFEITDVIEEDYNTKARSVDYSYTTIEGRIKFGRYQSPVFPLLRLPSIDRFGMIRHKKNLYTIAATSEPSKYVTYDGDSTLNLMLNAKNIKISYEPNKFKIYFGKNRLNMSTILYGVCSLHKMLVEGDINYYDESLNYIKDDYSMITPDATALLSKIVTPENISWMYANDHKFETMAFETDDPSNWTMVMNYASVIMGMFGLADISTNGIDPDAMNNVRDQLNEIINIDRGLGKILSRPIITKEGVRLAEAGQIVTKDLIAILNAECINDYYVSHTDTYNLDAKLACDIAIKSIPKDIIIPTEFREDNKGNLKHVPELTDKTYEFEPTYYPIIRQGTQLTAETVRLIKLSELTHEVQTITTVDSNEVTRSITLHGEKKYYTNTAIPVMKNERVEEFKLNNVIYITLEEEIMGNRHFKSGKEIYYVTEDGKRLPPAPHFTVYDIAALMSIMPRLNTDYIDRVSDRDIGLRKHICLIDEHIHKAIKKSCEQFSNMSYKTISDLLEGKAKSYSEQNEAGTLESIMLVMFNLVWSELGGSGMTVVQLADTTNPAALNSSAKRINTITKSKHGVSDSMRFLAMGFYGRICPYETPASSKLGLTNTKACHGEIENGELYTEYYRVIHLGGKHRVLTDKKYRMTVAEEEKYIIADITSLKLDNDMNILNADDIVFARVPSIGDVEKMETQNVDVSVIEYVNCYPDQTISDTATLVPYINSNESSRVTYGLNMARQSRPLLYREVPIIVTKGSFDIVRKNTMFQINAEDDGEIVDVNYSDRDTIAHDTRVTITVRYNNPVIYRHPNEKVRTRVENDLEVQYSFLLIEYSYKSVIERKVEVRVGDWVRKGDVLMSSNFTKDGIYAPGANAFLAVVPIGYNYEDGAQMADRLANKLTSYGHSDDTFVVRKETFPSKTRASGYIDSNATRIIKWEGAEGSGQSQYATSKKLRGFIVNRRVVEKDNKAQKQVKTKNYRVDAIYISSINEGDKNCNRHGNKGVVPKVLPNSEMLYLLNGEHVDIVHNPAGYASRMNLGQIKEIHTGLAAYVLGVHIGVQSFNELEWEEAILILDYAYDCANYGVDFANSNAKYSMYPKEFKDDVKANEKNILHWKGAFTRDGCATVINPKTGRPLRTPCVVGVNQITKLVQEVDEKEHTRGSAVSGSRYEKKGGRPTSGARRGGGQSYGHMEWSALLAHGTPNYIHELMHERGDNPYARQLRDMNLLGTDEVMKESDLNTLYELQGRRSVEEFFNQFKALGVRVEIEDPEFGIVDPDDVRQKDKFLYMSSAVLGEVKPYNDREIEQKDEEYKKNTTEAFDEAFDE